ncbi:MAG TPA: chemotaxis protein CheW [Chloroflexia bacterium]|nr:chemotaxis protein CheW [Chloroflexia bacterium]
MTPTSTQHIVFTLDSQRYALPLTDVEWVVQPTRLTLLTGSQGAVMGLVNVHGWKIPVVSLRKLHGKAERDLAPGNRLIILRRHDRKVALLVDSVLDGVTCDEGTRAPAPHAAHYPDTPETEDLVLLYEASRLLDSGAYHAGAAPNRIGRVMI